jgi:hypothetical protein
MRDAQHPLANRLFGKHLVNQQRGTLGHAPRTTAGAEAALLAAERDEVLSMATSRATHAQKAVLKAPTLEVGLELLGDVCGEVRSLKSQVRLERRVVIL